MNSKENWYEGFFHGLATEFWQNVVTKEYTDAEIEFIKIAGKLPAQARVLDVPCGFGRHSIALAQQGYDMTAIDIAEDYIQQLTKKVREMELPVRAVQANMLDYDPGSGFNLAICMGNSLNYFSNQKMKAFIGKIYRSLEAGCCFIIHTGALAESILPALRDRNWIQAGDVLYLGENIYHAADGVLQSNYRFLKGDRAESSTAWHFVYTAGEVIRMLKEEGFRSVKIYGDLRFKAYQAGDRQAYLVAVK